jgi:hypothetical protein
MGYRSDVSYKIKFFDKETMALFLAEARCKSEYKQALEDIRDYNTTEGLSIDEDNLCIVFNAHDTKWYDEFDSVQSHEELINLAKQYRDEHDKNIEYAFARTGEEQDDNDSYASDEGHDLVWISRQIMFG